MSKISRFLTRLISDLPDEHNATLVLIDKVKRLVRLELRMDVLSRWNMASDMRVHAGQSRELSESLLSFSS